MTWGCLHTLRNLDMTEGATWGEKDDCLGQEIRILRYLASETPENEGTKYFRGVCISTIACGGRRCIPSVNRIKNKFILHKQALNFRSKDNQDPRFHNRNFGVYIYLDKMERIY